MPKMGELDPIRSSGCVADGTVVWLFFFVAWSAFYLASQAQAETLGPQRRLADAESAAQAAQVRALRYQVNPHFLFNTLNSLSSLVMTGRTDRAEAMLLALSTFFRTSLSLDPGADVTLGRGNRSSAALPRHRKGALPRPAERRDRCPADLRKGATAGPAASADRRKCDQIWRVQEPQDRDLEHQARVRSRRPDAARSHQQAQASAARTSSPPRPTKGPALASPTSASGSKPASAAAPAAASAR